MIAYINGVLTYKDPAYAVIDIQGLGYEVKISLQTFSELPGIGEQCKLVTYLSIREDAHTLFGFKQIEEKVLFLDLVSVSGIGPSTALVMLSSLSSSEIRSAIVNEDLKVVQSIKGIGLKTAQRVILELRDKIKKELVGTPEPLGFGSSTSQTRAEALAALVTLGIAKPVAEKSIDQILKREGNAISLEQLIKLALR
jgi:Holliday junction DNA helicase RuvA